MSIIKNSKKYSEKYLGPNKPEDNNQIEELEQRIAALEIEVGILKGEIIEEIEGEDEEESDEESICFCNK